MQINSQVKYIQNSKIIEYELIQSIYPENNKQVEQIIYTHYNVDEIVIRWIYTINGVHTRL